MRTIVPRFARFMVYIDDLFMGHAIFQDNQWREFEGKMEDRQLVEAIGEYIAIWYE
jgi:hypothetical protein